VVLDPPAVEDEAMAVMLRIRLSLIVTTTK